MCTDAHRGLMAWHINHRPFALLFYVQNLFWRLFFYKKIFIDKGISLVDIKVLLYIIVLKETVKVKFLESTLNYTPVNSLREMA